MSDNMLFGLTMLLVGMGGTLLTLVFMAFVLRGLTLLFPVKPTEGQMEERKP